MSEVSQLEQLLAMKQGDQKHIDRYDALLRLKNNKDFQEVILKYFMVELCAEHAHNAANMGFSPATRQDAMAMATAAGHFKNFLLEAERAANAAKARAEELAEAIVSIRGGDTE